MSGCAFQSSDTAHLAISRRYLCFLLNSNVNQRQTITPFSTHNANSKLSFIQFSLMGTTGLCFSSIASRNRVTGASISSYFSMGCTRAVGKSLKLCGPQPVLSIVERVSRPLSPARTRTLGRVCQRSRKSAAPPPWSRLVRANRAGDCTRGRKIAATPSTPTVSSRSAAAPCGLVS